MENNVRQPGEEDFGVQTNKAWQELADDSLTNVENSGKTTWDDLAQVDFRDETDAAQDGVLPREKMPRLPYEVPKNPQRLSKEAQYLYSVSPNLAGRCEKLAKESKVDFTGLEKVLFLELYMDKSLQGYSLSEHSRNAVESEKGLLDGVSDQGVVELAKMYDYVSFYNDNGYNNLFEKSDGEIGETFRKFELMRETLGDSGPDPSLKQKATFWNRAKMKFLHLVSSNERKRVRAEMEKKDQRQFFVHQIFFLHDNLDQMDDESIVTLSKRARQNIDSGNEEDQADLLYSIITCNSYKRPMRECVDYLELRDEIPGHAIDEGSIRAQREALEEFYKAHGMTEMDKDFLRETVLPMVDSFDVASRGTLQGYFSQNRALTTAFHNYERGDHEAPEKARFVLQELMPLAGNVINEETELDRQKFRLMDCIFSTPMPLDKMRELTGYFHKDLAPLLELVNRDPCIKFKAKARC